MSTYDEAFALWRQCEGIGLSPAGSLTAVPELYQRTSIKPCLTWGIELIYINIGNMTNLVG